MTEFPRDWTVTRLDEVFDIGSSKRVFQSQWRTSGIPFYRARDIVGFVKGEEAVGGLFIDPELYEEFKRTYGVPEIDDLLVTGVGTLGKVYRVADTHPFYFKDGNIIWLKTKGVADSRFIEQLFISGQLDDQIFDTAGGSTVGTYTITSAKKTMVVLPPLPEQRRIAEALGSIDKLIDNLTRRIEKKRLMKQGVMQELLTGKKRLPGYKGEWKTKSISACATVKARIGWQGLTTAEYLKDGPHYLVNGTDFENGRVKWSGCVFVNDTRYQQDKNIQIRPYDVLVSKDGTIGKVAYIDDLKGTATLNSGVFVIRSIDDELNQEYLARVFLSSWFSKFIGKITAGSTIVHLYQKDIVTFEFLAPPTITEQLAIAAILSDMDTEIAKLEAKRDKYIDIKQGMMNDLLTGKVRI